MIPGAATRLGPEDDPRAEAVAAFLRENPDFLARRPDLYAALLPPQRVHGENLADHMTAMVTVERGRSRALAGDIRAATALAARVQLAVLALMRAGDVAEAVRHEWPALLHLESCTLLTEPESLPPGSLPRLLGRGRDARVRAEVTEARMLHAEAAGLVRRDALVRVPLPCGTPCLLALGARDEAALPGRQATAPLVFLGRALAAALARRP